MTTVHGRLADVLLQSRVIDADGLARAFEAQATRPATLGRTLAELGLAAEDVVARTIAAALSLEYHDGEPPSNADLTALLPTDFCRKRRTFPLALEGKWLRVAVTEPLDLPLLQDLEFRTGKKITAVVVTADLARARAHRRSPRSATRRAAGDARTTCSRRSNRPANWSLRNGRST